MALTPKQRRFADEYMIDLNPTRAYRAVYLSVKKDETAAAAAARLLKNVNVSDYIAERRQAQQQRTGITQDRVLRELECIGFAKASDYAKVDGSLVTITSTDQLSPEQVAAIAGIEQGKFGIKIKLHDKLKALELLGKHLGMFDKNAASHETEIEDDPLTQSIEEEIRHGSI